MISFQELSSCLGRGINSPEVTKFFSSCLNKHIVSFDGVLSKIYTCYESGCELHCNKNPERVYCIFLYSRIKVAGDKEVFAQYGHQLPSNITFDDDEDQVEQKLGKPSVTGSDYIHGASLAHELLKFDWLRYNVDDSAIRFCFLEKKLFRIDVQTAG